MLAKLIRRIKCCSVQEILMIVSIIMLLIVIANRTSAGIKARSASSGQITNTKNRLPHRRSNRYDLFSQSCSYWREQTKFPT